MRPPISHMRVNLLLVVVLTVGLFGSPVWAITTEHAVSPEEGDSQFTRPETGAVHVDVSGLAAAIAEEPLPDDGPRFDQPIYAPGSLPFREGLAALAHRAYGDAESAFHKVVEKFPKSVLAASAEAFLAELHLLKGMTPQSRADAIGQYRHLIVAHPNSSNALRAHWRIGDLYAGMGLYPEAHGAYSRLLMDGNPGRDLDRALLGSALNKVLWGKGAEAEGDFDRLRKQTKDEDLLRYASIGLADALALQRKFNEARLLYEAGYRAWPEEVKRRPRSFLSFAATYAELGSGSKARWLYEQFYNLYRLLRLGGAAGHARAGRGHVAS